MGSSFCNTTKGNIFADNRWVSSQFVCPQSMVMDRYLYDPVKHVYTVPRFLADLEERYVRAHWVSINQHKPLHFTCQSSPVLLGSIISSRCSAADHPLLFNANADARVMLMTSSRSLSYRRYGGIDCVLLWQSYTNLGVDEKNQIDLIRVLPGGVPGVTAMVADFHALGVTVLFPWNHWGNNSGHVEPDANFVDLLATVGADGFNEDSGGRSLIPGEPGYNPDQSKTASHGEDGTNFVRQGIGMGPVFNGHDLMDQPEHGAGCPVDNILGGWAGEGAGPGPGACVECAKWLEPRHTSEWVERHATMRQPGLKWAFFNGVGYNTWENVWGSWNGISPKDGETMRRIFTILRGVANVTSSCEWRPFYPAVSAAGTSGSAKLAATLFPDVDKGMVALTVINQMSGPIGKYTATLTMPSSSAADAPSSWLYFDLWRGQPILPRVQSNSGTAVVVHLAAESADEYAAIVAVAADIAATPEFRSLLGKMQRLSKTAISSYSAIPGTAINSTFSTNTMPTHQAPSGNAATARNSNATMVAVPEIRAFPFSVQTMISETHLEPVYPVSAGTSKRPSQPMAMGAFLIDKYPVTNEEFHAFVAETGYRPEDPGAINFVKEIWSGNGTSVPAGMERKPVVFVSFADANAYCAHQNKRLPNEWEWQFAAQGEQWRRWPWGNATRQECMPPSFNENNKSPPLPDVDAFDTLGCGSPFGAQLLSGSVWQWTNELADAHTRTALVKGGSSYWRVPTPLPSKNHPDRSFYYFGNCAQEYWQDFQHGGNTTVLPIECHGELYMMDGGYERASTLGFRCAADNGPKPPQPAPVPPPPPPPSPPGPGGDCRWYGGPSSTAPSCSWTDGTPDSAEAAIKSGLFAYKGTFGISVTTGPVAAAADPAADNRAAPAAPPAMRVLTVRVGVFCTAGKLTVSMPGVSGEVAPATIVVPPTKTPTAACRAQGADAATKNVAIAIYYTPTTEHSSLAVAWMPSAAAAVAARSDAAEAGASEAGADTHDEAEEGEGEGNITFQSATLALAPPGAKCDPNTICIQSPTAAAGTVNLTAEGHLDWVHFGGTGANPGAGTASLPAPLFPERKKQPNKAYECITGHFDSV